MTNSAEPNTGVEQDPYADLPFNSLTTEEIGMISTIPLGYFESDRTNYDALVHLPEPEAQLILRDIDMNGANAEGLIIETIESFKRDN